MPEPETTTTGTSDYGSIPAELRARRAWVARQGKKPISPHTGDLASVSDSITWGTFEEAVAAVDTYKLDGIGYVFSSGDPFVGIDLDDAIDPVAEAKGRELGLPHSGLKLWAKRALDMVGHLAYVERSTSGTGIHAILVAKAHGRGAKRSVEENGQLVGKIEVYDEGRYFVMTGDACYAGHLLPNQKAVNEIWSAFGFAYSGDDDQGAGWGEGEYSGEIWSTLMTDDDVLRTARNAANGDEFWGLFGKGTLKAHDGDHSMADAALIAMLAFYTGPNPDQIDRLFRRSKLHRDKWDEMRGSSTYGQRTVGYVLRQRGSDRASYYRSRAERKQEEAKEAQGEGGGAAVAVSPSASTPRPSTSSDRSLSSRS